jgi:hypothetical protein
MTSPSDQAWWSQQEFIGICTVQGFYAHGWLSITLKTPIATVICGNYEVDHAESMEIMHRHVCVARHIDYLNNKLLRIQRRRRKKPSVTEEEEELPL